MNKAQHTSKIITDYCWSKGITNKELAELVGVSATSLGRWKMMTEVPTQANFLKLCSVTGTPPPSINEIDSTVTQTICEPRAQYGKVRPIRTNELRSVPVLGFALAAGFEPAVESINDFAQGASDEYMPFIDAEEGDFALRVEGQSMAPTYPDGTLLLVSGTLMPERGDIVVAKLSDGGGMVVVKRYHRRSNVVILSSINPDGKEFEINLKEEPGRIIWMYPVRKAEIDLRARRNGKHLH